MSRYAAERHCSRKHLHKAPMWLHEFIWHSWQASLVDASQPVSPLVDFPIFPLARKDSDVSLCISHTTEEFFLMMPFVVDEWKGGGRDTHYTLVQ